MHTVIRLAKPSPQKPVVPSTKRDLAESRLIREAGKACVHLSESEETQAPQVNASQVNALAKKFAEIMDARWSAYVGAKTPMVMGKVSVEKLNASKPKKPIYRIVYNLKGQGLADWSEIHVFSDGNVQIEPSKNGISLGNIIGTPHARIVQNALGVDTDYTDLRLKPETVAGASMDKGALARVLQQAYEQGYKVEVYRPYFSQGGIKNSYLLLWFPNEKIVAGTTVAGVMGDKVLFSRASTPLEGFWRMLAGEVDEVSSFAEQWNTKAKARNKPQPLDKHEEADHRLVHPVVAEARAFLGETNEVGGPSLLARNVKNLINYFPSLKKAAVFNSIAEYDKTHAFSDEGVAESVSQWIIKKKKALMQFLNTRLDNLRSKDNERRKDAEKYGDTFKTSSQITDMEQGLKEFEKYYSKRLKQSPADLELWWYWLINFDRLGKDFVPYGSASLIPEAQWLEFLQDLGTQILKAMKEHTSSKLGESRVLEGKDEDDDFAVVIEDLREQLEKELFKEMKRRIKAPLDFGKVVGGWDSGRQQGHVSWKVEAPSSSIKKLPLLVPLATIDSKGFISGGGTISQPGTSLLNAEKVVRRVLTLDERSDNDFDRRIKGRDSEELTTAYYSPEFSVMLMRFWEDGDYALDKPTGQPVWTKASSQYEALWRFVVGDLKGK